MQAFSIRDLRERTGELSQEAEKGKAETANSKYQNTFTSITSC